MLLSLMYSFCSGNGCLPDVDVLKADPVSQRLLGLNQVPDSHRLGEYLSRCTAQTLEPLYAIIRTLSSSIVLQVITHHHEQDGYVPVFMAGSAIEVAGTLFEQAS